jgi:hypothetical protein
MGQAVAVAVQVLLDCRELHKLHQEMVAQGSLVTLQVLELLMLVAGVVAMILDQEIQHPRKVEQAGGGNGGAGSTIATAATSNTGGGGGGGAAGSGAPKAGGSGIVVVRYPGNVQYFTGGTLNYSNGFIVHTFYASGTLAPTTPRLFASPDYQIARSLRFNSADSAYLNRTPTATGSQQRFTVSLWTKLGSLATGTDRFLWCNGNAGVNLFAPTLLWKTYDGTYYFQLDYGSEGTLSTNAVYRDPSAWYHIVVNIDTAQATAANRASIYVNGVLQTYRTATYPTQNVNLQCNTAAYPMYIGALNVNSTFMRFFEGYITEVYFIDGQALTPASFGYTEPSTGVWTPLLYTGSYGTNGFYLNFSNPAALGSDGSGNGNAFTPNNFSVSAGAGNDSLVDSPTNYGTDTGVGGEVRGNYCTLNPLIKPVGTVAYSNGNLVATNSTANWNAIGGTIGISSGKWYWEYISGGQNTFFGIMVPTINFSSGNPQDANAAAGSVLLCDDNKYQIDYNTRVTYTATGHGSGTIVGVAVDMDAGTIVFYINGVSQGTITWTSSAAYGKTVIPMAVAYDSGYVTTANFGQRAFAYTAPTGFKALCSQNLPESTAGKLPGKYFGVATYTGNGSTNPVGPFGFQPDLSWTKSRSGTGGHNILRDSVRGSTKRLISNGAFAELDDATYGTFTYNGLSLGSNVNHNTSGTTYVAWAWAAGGTTVTNTAGSISAQVCANPAAGFSIVTYTGLTPWPQTIGHGLDVVPSMIIIKNRSRAATNWAVYHSSLGNTKGLLLDSTSSAVTDSGFWNNTNPTSSVFTTGNGYGYFVNAATDNYVAYCFAEIAGYSKFGSYTGNGSADGPFVYTGFRPAFILTKDITTESFWWEMVDSARSSYNPSNKTLYANMYDAEYTSSGYDKDLLSNGFKIRGTNGGQNASACTYIYMAFAESPFKYARAR